MARQVLPIVGAFVGAYFGNPQLGYAIGSIIGNAVDPLRVKGPTLKEIPSQTAGEGSFRQVVYGTCIIRDTNIVDFGEVERVPTETQQGKGGGPIVEGERLLRTYAIGLGEPFAAVRWIRRNGVVVYDVRPGSTILAESAAFAQRFRFYNGSETQLPDPDLEALPNNGVGNTPAYRGTAYLVFPRDDLTDLQGQIPTYEVEAVQEVSSTTGLPVLVANNAWWFGQPRDLELVDESLNFTSPGVTRVSPSGIYAVTFRRDLIPGINPAAFEISKFNSTTGQWELLGTPAVVPNGFMGNVAWRPDGDIFVATGGGFATDSSAVVTYRMIGDVATAFGSLGTNLTSSPGQGLCWDVSGSRLALTQATTAARVVIYDFDSASGLLSNKREGISGGLALDVIRMDWLPETDYIAAGAPTGTVVCRDAGSSVATATSNAKVSDAGVRWTADGNLVAIGGTAPQIGLYEFDSTVTGSETLTLVDSETLPTGSSANDSTITADRQTLAVCAVGGAAIAAPYLYDLSVALAISPLPSPAPAGTAIGTISFANNIGATIDGAPTDLQTIVADICDRCGIPAGKLDLTALTDEVAGITLGGQYGGAGAITTLMPAYFFDLFEADKKLVAVKRGAAVKATITVDDLVEEPDENSLRGQDTEYPRQLMVKYLNPGQNYAAPAAVVSRKTPDIRVRGEVTLDLPISLTETPALQIADKILKVMWEDLNGEATFTLPLGPFAWLTPSDCLGYVARSGAVYRLRVEKVNDAAREITITARRDRQSAYTSALTAIPLPAPPPPPPSLPGVTQVALLNIPGIVDGDDRLGFRIGVCGQQGSAWYGAQVSYSTDGGLSYTSLGNVTTRAVMGLLISPLSAASEFYPDRTNTIAVQLADTDELESLTEAQWLSEGNPAAIVRGDYTAEIVQFQTATDMGDKNWQLTTLQRGRLATSAAAHTSGARFVMLDGTVFLPLPSSLIGQTIKIRVTSLGTSPEVAPVFDFVFDPAYCQREFAPADLSLSSDGTDITASWSPRQRFGTEDSPIASANLLGYRVEATDGVTTKVTELVIGASHAIPEAAFAGSVTVTVYPINRFTGLGPSIAGIIDL